MAGKFTVDSGPKRTYSKPSWVHAMDLTPEEQAAADEANRQARVNEFAERAERNRLADIERKKAVRDLNRRILIENIQSLLWKLFWTGVVLSVVASFIFACAWATISYNSRECQTYAQVSGLKVQYSRFTGCLVEVHSGRWVTLESAATRSNEVTLRGDK